MAPKASTNTSASTAAKVKPTALGQQTLRGCIVKYGKTGTLFTPSTLGGRATLQILLAFAPFQGADIEALVTIYDRPAMGTRPALRAEIVENLCIEVTGELKVSASAQYADSYYLGPIAGFKVIQPEG